MLAPTARRVQIIQKMPMVSHGILSWARETAGLSLGEAVHKLGIGDARGVLAVDRLAAIEAGGIGT